MLNWDVNPEVFSIGFVSIRWYGLFFAISFMLGFQLMQRIFAAEKVSEKHLDRLFIYMVVGTIVGARLGHTLFYEPEIYLADPIRILKITEGGLASHGGGIGIFIALYLYSRKYKLGWLWMVDRLCLTVALAGGFIRLGNLFNSEILGKPSNVPWAVRFMRVDGIPRHPAMVYESITYFVIFAVLYHLYWKKKKGEIPGFLFGWFLIGTFGARFVWEFFKENQVSFESAMPINMGQILSIPMVLAGIWLVMRAARAQKRA